MYLNSFSVRIPEGVETTSGYVEMAHDKKYTIQLRNDRDVDCDAIVSVDGKTVGTFRVYRHGTVRLERPSNDAGRFTFYKRNSKAGRQIGLTDVDYSELGLVSVKFLPANQVVFVSPYRTTYWMEEPQTTFADSSAQFGGSAHLHNGESLTANFMCASRGSSMGGATGLTGSTGPTGPYRPNRFESGGTGLSGHSEQEFYTVPSLDYDWSQETTIVLRLVSVKRDNPRPLRPVISSNPVPPPVYR